MAAEGAGAGPHGPQVPVRQRSALLLCAHGRRQRRLCSATSVIQVDVLPGNPDRDTTRGLDGQTPQGWTDTPPHRRYLPSLQRDFLKAELQKGLARFHEKALGRERERETG